MAGTHLIVALPPKLARQVEEIVEAGTDYETMNDFLVAAVHNQVTLVRGLAGPRPPVDASRRQREASRRAPEQTAARDEPASDSLSMLRLRPAPPAAGRPVEPRSGPLPFLTNRANPLPVVARIVANIADERLDVASVRDIVADQARTVALRLVHSDHVERRRYVDRWSVGWPYGEDEEKSRIRFLDCFSLDAGGNGVLRDLGLAEVEDGRVCLSDRGWALAAAPCPLLEEGDSPKHMTVSEEAQEILRDALSRMEAESAEMAIFFRPLLDGLESQRDVDDAIRQAHPDWSDGLVASQRAGLIGRLRDLGVLIIVGRGPDARVSLTDQGAKFAEAIFNHGTESEPHGESAS